MIVILWPSVWAGKGLQIIRAARASQDPRLQTVNGRAQLIRHSDEDHVLQVGEVEFDLEGNPACVIMEGDEYTVYYLEATTVILSVDIPTGGK